MEIFTDLFFFGSLVAITERGTSEVIASFSGETTDEFRMEKATFSVFGFRGFFPFSIFTMDGSLGIVFGGD